MVVASLSPYIVRMGVEPRWKGLNTIIPVAMVSKRSYSILVAETYGGNKITFSADEGEQSLFNATLSSASPRTINSATWEPLGK